MQASSQRYMHMQEWCPVEKSQQETEEGADKVVCDIFPISPFTLCVYLEPSLPPPPLTFLHTSHSMKCIHPNHVLPLCTSYLSLPFLCKACREAILLLWEKGKCSHQDLWPATGCLSLIWQHNYSKVFTSGNPAQRKQWRPGGDASKLYFKCSWTTSDLAFYVSSIFVFSFFVFLFITASERSLQMVSAVFRVRNLFRVCLASASHRRLMTEQQSCVSSSPHQHIKTWIPE